MGSQPGSLALSPTTGALTSTPTWATTDGCPAGFQGSAQLAEFTSAGTLVSRISPTVAGPAAAFSGTLDGSIGALLNTAGSGLNASTGDG